MKGLNWQTIYIYLFTLSYKMCTHAHRLIKNEIVSKIWHFLSSCFSIFNHTLFKRNSTLAYFTSSEMCQLVWISNTWFCTKQPVRVSHMFLGFNIYDCIFVALIQRNIFSRIFPLELCFWFVLPNLSNSPGFMAKLSKIGSIFFCGCWCSLS